MVGLLLLYAAMPALAADNSTQGVLKKGSSDTFYNGLNADTKENVDWLTGAVAWFFKWGAIVALMIGGVIIMLAKKRHNAHDESEGMESLIKTVVIVVIVVIGISLIGQIFTY